MNLHARVLLAGLCALATSGWAQAQSFPSRTGLWAWAQHTTLNGHKLPGKLDIKGAMAPAQRAAIMGAMQALGLPQGWDPGLSCQTQSQVDVNDQLRDAKSQGCQVKLADRSSSSVRFTMQCARPDGAAMQGEGEFSGIGSAEVRARYAMTGEYQGQPLKMQSESISKWIGPDCKHPPAGISPEWVGM